jgi:acetyl esterase/lipase
MAAALAGAVLLAACGSSSESTVGEPAPSAVEASDPPVTQSSTTVAATTAAPDQPAPTEPPPATVVPADATAFTTTTDVVYATADGVEFAMDIYTPTGDGPWPVVLNYHGLGSKNDEATTIVSETAATNGFLVYTPSWIGDAFPFTTEVFDAWKDRASCSVAFAQQHAAANGGDATHTILYGFSAGVGPVMFAAHQPRTEPVDGCATREPPVPPVGAILGDGPYFLHDPGFDVSFEADLAGMQEEVAALVDPANGPGELAARFFMWIPENDTGQRPLEDGSDWLSMRDPDGSIRTDLDELGMLDDGTVSNRDAAHLFELRLSDAGFDVALDEYLGGHTTADKASELVDYMQRAVDR